MSEQRVAVFWAKEPAVDNDVEARRLDSVIAAFADIDEQIATWMFIDEDDGRTPVSRDGFAERLAAGELQDDELPNAAALRASCHVVGRFSAVADLAAFVGVRHDGPKEMWAPNHVMLVLYDIQLSDSQLARVLDAMVRAFEPLWGFVDDGGPPVYSLDGKARVGWLTYLHRDYGRPAEPLEGSVVRRSGSGRLFRAFKTSPSSADERNAAQTAMAGWLENGGALRSFSDVLRDPHPFLPDEAEALPGGRASEVPVPTTAPSTPVSKSGPAPSPPAHVAQTKPALPMDLEDYADLCAALQGRPEKRSETMAERGMTFDAYVQVNTQFRALFKADPALQERWSTLVTQFRSRYDE